MIHLNSTNAETALRSQELLSQHQEQIYKRTDGMFAGLMAIQYLAGIAAAYFISPKTWSGTQSTWHLHLYAAIVLGAIITSLPLALTMIMPGKALTRHVIAISQMLFSALLIHLTGGRIETHFHIFGSLAFLGFYRDWRVLISASFVVALDHYLRGLYWPESVYGIISVAPWRWLEHTGWVVFEDVFLFLACSQNLREMKDVAVRQAQIEQTKHFVENAVIERTRELREINERLQTTQGQLLQSQKLESLGQLAGGIAHDFNNILAGILGDTGLLKRQLKELPDAQRKLSIIEKSIHRGSDLINQLLGFARKGDYEKKPLSLNELVKEVTVLLSSSLNKNIEIKTDLQEKLPYIEGDSSQIIQVLMNLAVNARDAMLQGGTLHIKSKNTWITPQMTAKHPELSVGPYVVITVRDTGGGIPLHIKDKIFDPFFTTKDIGKGTGLGLSMVYGIIHNHGGLIDFETEEGKGTCFYLYFPTFTPKSKVLDLNEQPTEEEVFYDLKEKTILVAEDEENIRELYKEVLAPTGAKLLFAQDGLEATRLYSEHKDQIDIVILDLVMPKKDGIATYHEIHRLGGKVNVLFSSGYSEAKEIATLRKLEHIDFIQKPFKASELNKRLYKFTQPEVSAATH